MKGRPTVTALTLFGGLYTTTLGYDDWGRPVTTATTRPNGAEKVFGTRYDITGGVNRIERGNLVLWRAIRQDAAGRPLEAALGGNLMQTRAYDPYTGRQVNGSLSSAMGEMRLTEGYQYDEIGSVKQRTQYWDASGFQEWFTYDALNRLKTSSMLSQPVQAFDYDDAGNITSKTDVGTYAYPAQGAAAVRPHAVQSITGLGAFAYDANGNLESGAGRTISWTSFDMPEKITKGTTNASFVYGPEHQRTRQIRSDGAVVVYAGAQEVETKAGQVVAKTYWPNGVGVEIDAGAAPPEMSWIHADRLGSVVALTDQNGVIKEKMAYDAWGKRRALATVATPDSIDGQVDNRGFTGHEMLDQLDLVHMNGRVYDPLTAKFMSGDPLIIEPSNGQNYNRYSYVLNNPTNLTDPTGFAQCEKTTGSNVCGGGGSSNVTFEGGPAPNSPFGKWLYKFRAQWAKLSGAERKQVLMSSNGTETVSAKNREPNASASSSGSTEQMVPNPLAPGCKVGPCKPSDWKAPIDWRGAGKATVGMVGNAGGVVAGAVMWGAPTVATQVVGGYLIADGTYGVVANGLDFAAAVGWKKEKVGESVNSLPRLAANALARGNESAQRAADAVSLAAGFIGGKMIVQPLMFSTRKIYATSNMSPAAQMGLSGYSILQAYDASVPAAETIQKVYEQK